MQPALSIISLTTASGAGFGLLFLIGIGAPLDFVPAERSFGFAALAVAAVLIGGGLLASVFHLGRPERAWRGLSQWRSSWLSREGVLALLTLVPAAVLGIGWLLFGTRSGVIGLFGILAAALATATVVATGMIYASLKPVRQWRNPWVVPNYLLIAAMSGYLLLDFLVRFWERAPAGIAVLTVIVVLLAWCVKEGYWRSIDRGTAASTVESATLLGRRGRVRVLERPHTEENYLLKEMGFAIARKHRLRLRRLARLLAFLVPALLSLYALVAPGTPGAVAAALAVLSAGLGLFVERWLFFAEATHTVTLYYGAAAV
jgi:DMSO reductase anchor subunit